MKSETKLQEEFLQTFNQPAVIYVRAPGRVNLLGEHIDYNGGPVLPMAIDREVTLMGAPNSSDTVKVYAQDLNQAISFNLLELEQKNDLDGIPLPKWALYPAGVAWALQQTGMHVSGANIMFSSNVPIGSGLSSSAAVEVGFGFLWSEYGDRQIDRLELARLCQHAENDYVGVSSGLMDQFASACGVEGHALFFDTRNLAWEPISLPPHTAVVIADSGVRRSLTDSAYNERRASCEQAVEILRQYKPDLESLRDIQPPEFMAFSPYLPQVVSRRAEHVVKEIARVESARSVLERGDADAFGALMFAGHASLRDLYEVSTPELDILVELARGTPGCYGARLTGAGFGGCTVNLVETEYVEDFIINLQDGYNTAERETQIYLCHAAQGATAKKLDE